MPEPATFLLAIADPADSAHPMIERTAQIAQALQARVVLFHAAFDSSLSGRPFFDSPKLAKARGRLVAEHKRALEVIATTLRSRGIETEALVAWEEPAHESIVRTAIRCDVQLVIAGEHRRADQWSGWTLTDWELLRLCPRPLLLVQASAAKEGVVLAALDPSHSNDKPAALDAAIAAKAAWFATGLGVELHAVHCLSRSTYPLDTTPAERKRIHKRMTARVRSTLKKAKASASEIHVLDAGADESIPKLARELPAQVLVLGAISRRGLKRFAIGNTAERLIHQSPCDLLIVKPPGFKPRLGRARKQAITMPNE